MTIKSNCADAELSVAVAQAHGWELVRTEEQGWKGAFWRDPDGVAKSMPAFSTSADAVLPLLEKTCALSRLELVEVYPAVPAHSTPKLWHVTIIRSIDHFQAMCIGSAETFTRAACFALLKAKGWTVEVAT